MQDQHCMLADLARQAMIDRGFEPDFSPDVERQLASIDAPAHESGLKDMRDLLWCSIDNDDSRDLDQLTVAEETSDGVRVLVAVADVDAVVRIGTPIDEHAKHNTTSIYTAAKIFSMLPEKLSTNLTSLNEAQERVAVVMDMQVSRDGTVSRGDVYRALVHNKAQLAYESVGMWLEGHGEMPPKVKAVKGLADNLKLQDKIADAMRENRHEHGALDLETIEPRAIMRDGQVVDLRQEARNNARNLIEDFMIAANGVTARFLDAAGLPSIRRIVREPKRWDRIVDIAQEHGERLPGSPDAVALEQFLVRQHKADPLRFPDLSLAIVKAMGAGEYVVERPGESIGHFGLAVRDYTHSTAPNRRYPDLIAHRMVKAALSKTTPPYSHDDLAALATHCTEAEDAANKVERQVRKSAAACLLSTRINETFDPIVTGAGEKGTWVRVFHPPAEGKLVHGFDGLDIGHRVRVKLVSVDVERGFIDFVRSHR